MPFPSLADAGWIVFYVPTFAGIIRPRAGARRPPRRRLRARRRDRRARDRRRRRRNRVRRDRRRLRRLAACDRQANIAYPLGDLAMLALVIGVLAASGWQLTRRWAGLALGLAVFAVADTLYVFMIAEGTYEAGTLIDSGWVLASTITALAAWQPERAAATRRAPRLERIRLPRRVRDDRPRDALVYDHFHRVHLLALVLSSAWRRGGDRADDAHLQGEPRHAASEQDRGSSRPTRSRGSATVESCWRIWRPASGPSAC